MLHCPGDAFLRVHVRELDVRLVEPRRLGERLIRIPGQCPHDRTASGADARPDTNPARHA